MFAILYRLLLSLYSELSFRTIRRKRNAKCHNFEVPLKDGWNVNFVLFDKRLIFPRLNKCHIDVQYYVLYELLLDCSKRTFLYQRKLVQECS